MHILWDWNGTLLDDTPACVASLNIMLSRRGIAPVTMQFFRENFAFPARRFYKLVGMEVPDEEWEDLAREYHRTYLAQDVSLNRDSVEALSRVQRAGAKQSILSALRQDLLQENIERFRLGGYFEYVFGSDNLDGGSKLSRALELFPLIGDDEIVLIGDSLHDKEVADALGIRCVLVSCGSHSYERLAAVAPTAHDLLEAVLMLTESLSRKETIK